MNGAWDNAIWVNKATESLQLLGHEGQWSIRATEPLVTQPFALFKVNGLLEPLTYYNHQSIKVKKALESLRD